jgi:hypothetical protein
MRGAEISNVVILFPDEFIESLIILALNAIICYYSLRGKYMELKCTKCEFIKNDEQFSKNKTLKRGFSYYCKECAKASNTKLRRSKGQKEKRNSKIIGDTKLCIECNIFLPFNNFTKNTRGLAGRVSYCIPCSKVRSHNLYYNKEASRIQTQKYRDENREYWRSKHRIHQAERRYKIKVQSDGTVTPAFCRELYSREICYFCNKCIPKDKRTLEHKHSIFKGGLHGASNIEMACLSCNSSKRHLSEEEFKDYKNKS